MRVHSHTLMLVMLYREASRLLCMMHCPHHPVHTCPVVTAVPSSANPHTNHHTLRTSTDAPTGEYMMPKPPTTHRTEYSTGHHRCASSGVPTTGHDYSYSATDHKDDTRSIANCSIPSPYSNHGTCSNAPDGRWSKLLFQYYFKSGALMDIFTAYVMMQLIPSTPGTTGDVRHDLAQDNPGSSLEPTHYPGSDVRVAKACILLGTVLILY